MAEKDTKNSYRLVAKCGTCGAHIVINISLDVEETPEYGKSRKVNHEILPQFIKGAFRSAQGFINNTPRDTTTSKQSVTKEVICSQCWKILKLKE